MHVMISVSMALKEAFFIFKHGGNLNFRQGIIVQ